MSRQWGRRGPPIRDPGPPGINTWRLIGVRYLFRVSLPLAEIDDCPLGLSVLGPRGADLALLDLTASVIAQRA